MLKFTPRQLRILNYYLGKADTKVPIIYGDTCYEVVKSLLRYSKHKPYCGLINRHNDYVSINYSDSTIEIYFEEAYIKVSNHTKDKKFRIDSCIYNRTSSVSILDKKTYRSITKGEYLKIMNEQMLKDAVKKLVEG